MGRSTINGSFSIAMMLFGRNWLHQIDVKRRIPGADCLPEAMKNICIYGQKSSLHATRHPTKNLNTWRRARNYPVDKNVHKFWSGDIKHGSEISHTWASNGIYNQKKHRTGLEMREYPASRVWLPEANSNNCALKNRELLTAFLLTASKFGHSWFLGKSWAGSCRPAPKPCCFNKS